MYLVSFQATFLQPDILTIPGLRGNYGTGLACGFALLGVWSLVERKHAFLRSREKCISLALLVLIIASAIKSGTPTSSFLRGLTLAASGLGGYWCGRKLLTTRQRIRAFAWYCMLLLTLLCAVCLAGNFYYGHIEHFLPGAGPHPLMHRIMLMGFAPLYFVYTNQPGLTRQRLSGIFVLVLCYLVFIVGRVRSTLFLPVLGVGASLFVGAVKKKHFFILLAASILCGLVFAHLHPKKWEKITTPTDETFYYRIESYPFSWHIAQKHPLLGIGLRAPRMKFLADYEISYPYGNKTKFSRTVENIRTSENIFLTFMVDLGLPFVLLYLGAVLYLIGRLTRMLARHETNTILPPIVLFLPLVIGMVYSMLYDSFLYPQVCWFFHLLLGIIPNLQKSQAADSLPTP